MKIAKAKSRPVKERTASDTVKDDKVTVNTAKNASEAKLDGKKKCVVANIEFYDLNNNKLRKIGDEWSEDDEKRVSMLKSRGFITVL